MADQNGLSKQSTKKPKVFKKKNNKIEGISGPKTSKFFPPVSSHRDLQIQELFSVYFTKVATHQVLDAVGCYKMLRVWGDVRASRLFLRYFCGSWEFCSSCVAFQGLEWVHSFRLTFGLAIFTHSMWSSKPKLFEGALWASELKTS